MEPNMESELDTKYEIRATEYKVRATKSRVRALTWTSEVCAMRSVRLLSKAQRLWAIRLQTCGVQVGARYFF